MPDREPLRRLRRCLLVALALAGCSDASRGGPNAGPDAGGSVPPPPTLGRQIDRAGRPAISATLVGVFASPAATQTAIKDTYNQAADPAAWLTTLVQPGVTIERELQGNLAVFDALDNGLATAQGVLTGCRNALKYSGLPRTTVYQPAAALFGDDRIYVDTSKPTCAAYLALEIEHASGGSYVHTTCGGRAPSDDVIDATYSVLAAGLAGFDRTIDLSPLIRDGISRHTDTLETFPFLGPPHPR